MRTTLIRAAIAALTLTTTIGLAACSNDDGGMSGMPMDHNSSTASPAASPAPSTRPAGPHNSQDVIFAQMMIPHHQQAIEMSDMLLAKDGIDPRVTKLAQQIKAAQGPEITTMRGWLTSWGANPSPSAMDHSGHDMGGMDDGMGGGMMSQADMNALKNATGDKAARLFLSGMTAHHRGAIAMAKTEAAKGENDQAKKLADSIITSQQAEIDTMTKLLANL